MIWPLPPLLPGFQDDLSFARHPHTAAGRRAFWLNAPCKSAFADRRPGQHGSRVVVDDAREPLLSTNGRDLAFIRDDHGRGRLIERAAICGRWGARNQH